MGQVSMARRESGFCLPWGRSRGRVCGVLDICLLGTGGTQPLANRWLTSLMVRYCGHNVLVDCGEGTQVAASEAGMSLKPVDKLLLTHLHADHVSGLPGLLLSMGNSGRTEPLSIIGPVGTERVVRALRIIANNLPFEVQVSEIDTEEQTMFFLECDIRAFALNHGVPCYGYTFELPRAGKFDVQRAKDAGIPLRLWKSLQRGETVQAGERTFTPDMVMGPPRRGIKVTYCTDTRPTPAIPQMAANSDLFICEGMYGNREMIATGWENRHLLFEEAAQMARDAGGVKELWLTHYSPSMPNPKAYLDVARAIFPGTYTPRDGWSKSITFTDE